MGFLGWVLWVFRVFHWMWCWAARSPAKERKSWKREGEEAEEPRCCSSEFARAGPHHPCLGLARPTPFSRPTPAEERENCGREKRKRQRSHDAVRRSLPTPILAAHAWVWQDPPWVSLDPSVGLASCGSL
jgi:hypothetical protein